METKKQTSAFNWPSLAHLTLGRREELAPCLLLPLFAILKAAPANWILAPGKFESAAELSCFKQEKPTNQRAREPC